MNFKISLMKIKGVGNKTFDKLKNLNLETISDALYYFPKNYVDRGDIKLISEFLDGEYGTLKAIVQSVNSKGKFTNSKGLLKIVVADESFKCEILFFNAKFLMDKINVGDEILFYGQMKVTGFKRTMFHPEHLSFHSDKAKEFLGIRPVYSLTKNLTQNEIYKIQRQVIKYIDFKMAETLPNKVIIENNLCSIDFALTNIHFPEDQEALEISKKRLIYEELFKLQMALAIIKGKNTVEKGPKITMLNINDVLSRLPFELTTSQISVIDEIFKDLKSEKSMNRLIQGDVGSGKTVIAMLSMIVCAKSGFQAVLMVPTEILAEQHYNFIKEYTLGYGIELLCGSSKNKKEIYERIKVGTSKIIIGTHALIQDKIFYKNIGLVITDEQHRFGVRQRNVLYEKGLNPNVLIMSATPIPRTLSLILYGDVDISIIDELPKGRLPIKTHYIKNEKIDDMYGFIYKNVLLGRQVYLICPLVEESEKLNLNSIEKYYKNIVKRFPNFNVGFIFGKMKTSDKDRIMKSFSRNEINILVSTTVIEVGIDVPNTNIIVINDCERFGLAQLHQLRGRVGRGNEQSYCFLVSNNITKIASERIKVMCKTNDGFKIADRDLTLRGPGEIIGVKQHGVPEFKISNLSRDLDILKLAQRDAFSIYNSFKDDDCSLFIEKYLKNIFEKFTI